MACNFYGSQNHRKFVGLCRGTTNFQGKTLTWKIFEEIAFRVRDQILPGFVIKLYNTSLARRLNNVLKSKGTVSGC